VQIKNITFQSIRYITVALLIDVIFETVYHFTK